MAGLTATCPPFAPCAAARPEDQIAEWSQCVQCNLQALIAHDAGTGALGLDQRQAWEGKIERIHLKACRKVSGFPETGVFP